MKNKMTAPVWALLLMLCPVLLLPIAKFLFPLIELNVWVYLLFSFGAIIAGYNFFRRKKQAQKMNKLYDEFNNSELVENYSNIDKGNLDQLLLTFLFYIFGSIVLIVLLSVHYKKQGNSIVLVEAASISIACIFVFIGWIRLYGYDIYKYHYVDSIKKSWLVLEYPDKEATVSFIIITKGEYDPNEEKIKSLELKRLREEIQSTLQEDIVAYNKKQQEKLKQKEREEKESQKTVKEEEKKRQEILRLVNMS